jgi:serine/threonine-protein kinase
MMIDGLYRVLRPLGSGGGGELVVAFDEVRGRKVAVKLQHLRFSESTRFYSVLGQRLVNEATFGQSLADVRGIPAVYDHGKHLDRRYVVMELIDGVTLRDFILDCRPVRSETAVAVVAQLCAILSVVHDRSLVHRDVKPENIIIKPCGEVLLLDLGIAVRAGSDITSDEISGTPGYAPHEQIRGSGVTARADIYALGCLLCEMVTMCLPYTEEQEWNIGKQEHSASPELIATLPVELRELVVSMVSRDPLARPASTTEVLDRLASLLPAPGSPRDPKAPRPDPTAWFRNRPRPSCGAAPGWSCP